jgi:hypothetical protein
MAVSSTMVSPPIGCLNSASMWHDTTTYDLPTTPYAPLTQLGISPVGYGGSCCVVLACDPGREWIQGIVSFRIS